jgi:hypothetical protein
MAAVESEDEGDDVAANEDDGLEIGWTVSMMINATAVILAVAGLIRLASWLLG